jgi:hypothetical protein
LGEAAAEAFGTPRAAAANPKPRYLSQIDIERSATALISKEGSEAAASGWAVKRAYELQAAGDNEGWVTMLRIECAIRRRLETPEDIKARQAYRNEF